MKKIIVLSVRFIQVIFCISIFVLNDLTTTKPLVMRHVYQRSLVYNKFLLSNVFVTISTIILGVLLLYFIKDTYKKSLNLDRFVLICILVAGIIFIHLSFFRELMVYPYLLLAYLIVFAGQLLVNKYNQ